MWNRKKNTSSSPKTNKVHFTLPEKFEDSPHPDHGKDEEIIPTDLKEDDQAAFLTRGEVESMLIDVENKIMNAFEKKLNTAIEELKSVKEGESVVYSMVNEDHHDDDLLSLEEDDSKKELFVEDDEKRNQGGRGEQEEEGDLSRDRRAVMYDLSGGNAAPNNDFITRAEEGGHQNNNIYHENDNQSQTAASRYNANESDSHPNATTDHPAMRTRRLSGRRSIFNRFLFGRSTKESKVEGELDADTYTMMMLTQPPTICQSLFCFAFLFCGKANKVWLLGLMTFFVQAFLGCIVIMDQLFDVQAVVIHLNYSLNWNIPVAPSPFASMAQALVIPLALITQTDIISSMATLHQLRHNGNNPWHETIGLERSQRTFKIWMLRIFLPNILKFIEGLLVLFATWVVVCQSASILDLLKDFTALFAISSIDDLLYSFAQEGYLGDELQKKSRKVSSAKIDDNAGGGGLGWIVRLALLAILGTMIGGWGYLVVYGQYSGKLFKEEYPRCDFYAFWYFGDGYCDYQLNNAECGFDNGDCDGGNVYYPECLTSVNFETSFDEDFSWNPNLPPDFSPSYYEVMMERLGDGNCDWQFNRKECGWDDFDCVEENMLRKYPNCTVDNLRSIGNGICDGGEYNTKECHFDGGDCDDFNLMFPNCTVRNPRFYIGTGHCDGGDFNTEECLWDGGDCDEFNRKYPNCTVGTPSAIGNGVCDGGEYYTVDCLWDDGDCDEFYAKYPNCKVEYPFWVGDGECDGGQYDTEECDWDGGDC